MRCLSDYDANRLHFESRLLEERSLVADILTSPESLDDRVVDAISELPWHEATQKLLDERATQTMDTSPSTLKIARGQVPYD